MDLPYAAEHGDLERVQLLLGQGVDKDKPNLNGYTALWNASQKGYLPIVQCLVEQGADKDKASYSGITSLNIASYKGHLDVVRHLLEQGADRDKSCNNGWTPLHRAAHEGHLETVMLLMSYGADLNAKTNEGLLPIDVADTEEIKQSIRDEPRRRMDHGHKRATEQDRYPHAAASALEQQKDDVEVGENNEGRCLDKETEEAKILAEIDEDSEPSSDEENG